VKVWYPWAGFTVLYTPNSTTNRQPITTVEVRARPSRDGTCRQTRARRVAGAVVTVGCSAGT
jgi:hypothetical protein